MREILTLKAHLTIPRARACLGLLAMIRHLALARPYRVSICFASWAISTTLSAGELNFANTSVTIAENASTFDIAVLRSGTSNQAAAVTVKSADGSAVVVEDYLNVSSALSWNAGDISERVLSISVLDDTLLEGDESFSLNLVNVSGDTLGIASTLTITIDDYENGQLSFTTTSHSINEQDSQLVLGILREQGEDGDIAVNFSSAPASAVPDLDFLEKTSKVEFADGETYKLVALDIVDDNVAELAEELTIHLSDFSGGSSAGAIIKSTVIIEDNDIDFTPSLNKLNTSTEQLEKQNSIDLSQAIPSDTDTSFLTLLNLNPVLAVTDLEVTQASSGIASIVVGDSRATFRPTTVIRSQESDEIGIFLLSDDSGFFSTAEGMKVNFQPAFAGIDVLQKALVERGLPKIVLTDKGSVTVQKDQGPPPLLQDSSGLVYIDNAYYDRFHFRPSLFSTLSSETSSGIGFIDSQLESSIFDLLVIYNEGNKLWQQALKAAPVDQLELLAQLNSLVDISDITAASNEKIRFKLDDRSYILLPDVTIKRVENFKAQDVGLIGHDETNSDGQIEFIMTYSSGDSQKLVAFPM